MPGRRRGCAPCSALCLREMLRRTADANHCQSLLRLRAGNYGVGNPAKPRNDLYRNETTFRRAPHLPALNRHLTKSRLNDGPPLCDAAQRNLSRIEGKKVESSWARVDAYE